MSLRDDFNMYYNSTTVGYRVDGLLVPFVITDIRMGRGFDNDDFSNEAVSALKFSGYYNNDRGQVIEVTVPHDDENLVLEMPELGYILYRDKPMFLYWKPQRSTKKGMCGRRISGHNGRFNYEMSQIIYKMVNDNPMELTRYFLKHENNLHYKGRIIGTYEGDVITLKKGFHYLRGLMDKVFIDSVVNIEEK